MKLSTMKAVDATVRPDRSSPIAETILLNWEHDHASIQWFRSSANFVYQFRHDGQRRFLRFIEVSERDKEQIEEEMSLLVWLAASGIRIAQPIKSRMGNLVETVVTEAGSFHAVVFAGLEGEQFEVDELSESQYGTWGATLGRLHAAVQGYKPSRSKRKSWKDDLDFASHYISDDQHGVRAEWTRIRNWAESLPVNENNFGLIHYDFELDNLCWNAGNIGILDFDDCLYYWYVADIAFALRDLFDGNVDYNHPSFRAFVAGYTEHFPNDPEMLEHLPMFLRLHDLVTYAKLVRTLDVPREELPTWLRGLGDKLNHWVASYRTSLERTNP